LEYPSAAHRRQPRGLPERTPKATQLALSELQSPLPIGELKQSQKKPCTEEEEATKSHPFLPQLPTL
jgi:hypothetical protein